MTKAVLPAASVVPPRFLYAHGFASSPGSFKGVALAEHYAARGVHLERLDLRRPSLEHLRVSEMVATLIGALGGPADRAVVFGSSLGALVACRAAERDPRIAALVLLAPAFRIVERWRARVGEDGWRLWQQEDGLDVVDFATGRGTRVDFGFALDAMQVDAPGDGWPDVRVPTLIVQGLRDDVVDPTAPRTWAAGKRHVHLVEVDDGHELRESVPRIKDESDAFLAPWFANGDTHPSDK